MDAQESTPLIQTKSYDHATNYTSSTSHKQARDSNCNRNDTSFRYQVYIFLESKSYLGLVYEKIILILILGSILSFVLGTLFLKEYYNPDNDDAPTFFGYHLSCGTTCDAYFFGNYEDNDLAYLNLGPTSILEIVTVAIFTFDYLLRFWTADYEHPSYKGLYGRVFHFIPSFYSLVDLASILPFYIDVYLVEENLASSQFLRMFRLFRMMKMEGRYDTALTLFDDVFYEQRGILATALFIGATTWIAVSSLYYLTERRNLDMIYCGEAGPQCADVDTSLCVIDSWGKVDCSSADCTVDNVDEPCYNLFRSIPHAMYYSLLNLFGEFPLIQQHSPMGKIVGTLTAIIAAAVFALPTGIVGNGFEDLLQRRKSSSDNTRDETENELNENDTPVLSNRFQRYMKAFSTFDKVIRSNSDLFVVTGVAALIMWIFFSAMMYLSERDNPDPDLKQYYCTVPHAMWITLLNLSGESPLWQYTLLGKILTGLMGLFATGLFGIPIGILGSGFEDIMSKNNVDTPDEDDEENITTLSGANHEEYTNRILLSIFNFVNGQGGCISMHFELLIYFLIIITVVIGVVQTIDGYENFLHVIEWMAVIIFTFEYTLRFIASPMDSSFHNISKRSPLLARLRFLVSFYSIIDLLAILPFYLSYFMPGGWVDQHDEFLRMLRLIRLVKLDKYVPSITLIDDVFRLKKTMLGVTCFASSMLWIIFGGLLYLFESSDKGNQIDSTPLYNCGDDCTMADRFNTFISSMFFTGIHLTGDYPIIQYCLSSRIVCFFMVIAAVGIVSIPSGLIASGFEEIVQSRVKTRNQREEGVAISDGFDGDWYEYQLSLLRIRDDGPPPSYFGPTMDKLQLGIHRFLNGTVNTDGTTSWSPSSIFFRFFMMMIILLNVVAVLLESIPEVDKAVGNEPGNIFDVFEGISVIFFATEYIMRLFSASKNPKALYSPLVYAFTFYGIIDFLSTAPWFVEYILLKLDIIKVGTDAVTVFRLFRIFRILQLEDFITAFSKLDDVFRASRDVLRATGLLALIIWVGCGALFYIFEQDNPNWQECIVVSVDSNDSSFEQVCHRTAFVNMADSLYYTAVFLGGEWGLVDFTWQGRIVCMFLCVAGIALYAIPVGTFFDSFGSILGMGGDDDDDDNE